MINGVTITTTCPQCDRTISFDARPHIGQLHACPHCAELLTVLLSAPLLLDFAMERPLIISRTEIVSLPSYALNQVA